MPEIYLGEGYRSFSEPSIFEAEDDTQIAQVEYPTDKSFVIVAADDGSSDFELWKFSSSSTTAASATVIVPLNPLYAVRGRWIKMPGSGGGPGGSGVEFTTDVNSMAAIPLAQRPGLIFLLNPNSGIAAYQWVLGDTQTPDGYSIVAPAPPDGTGNWLQYNT